MLYIIHYDIAALLILSIVTSVFIFKKKLPDTKNNLFIAICINTFFSTVFDLFSGVLASFPDKYPNFLHWTVNMFYFMIVNFLPVLFVIYCFALSNKLDIFQKKRNCLLFFFPYLIDLVLILLTPVFHIVYKISQTNEYSRQNGLFFLYVVAIYYVIFGLVLLSKYSLTIDHRKRLSAYSFVILSLLSILIQLFFPKLLMQNFGIALCTMLMFLSLQNSEQLLDGITALFNQKAFDIMSTRLFETKKPFYIIGIVIDDLPFLNNTFGIAYINSIQFCVAEYLQLNSLENRVYHLNQGEFCVLLPDFDINKAESILESIRIRFAQPWIYELVEVKLSSRLCLIACPQDADKSSAVIDIISTVATDNRYKQEKLIYARNMDTFDLLRIGYIERQLKTAIQDGRIDVYYQALYSTKEKRIIGAEALVRLKDENGKFISPEEFIPIAEKNGSILRIGLFIFDHVCHFMSSTRIYEYGVNMIDINLSVAQCMQNSLAGQLIEIMKIYNLSPKFINLEITETAAAHTPEILQINMEKLSDFGFDFSLDDYGSGYANINYILHLPFSMIKIDKDIIWTAFKDKEPRAFAIMTGIIDMMKKLNMRIVAEGIDSKEMVDKLSELGCDFLQGYYFSEPLPQQAFFHLVQENSPVKPIKIEPIDSAEIEELESIDEIEEI